MASVIWQRIAESTYDHYLNSPISHFLHARQSESDTDRSFGGSNGAIALYVVFGIIVLSIVFTTVFRSHRGRYAFSSRPQRSVYQNQPTPWNPSSFSHHRGTSQSSGDNTGYTHGQSSGPWAGRVLNRLTARGGDGEQHGAPGRGDNQNLYQSAWPSSRRNNAGNALPFSGRDQWVDSNRTSHVAVPPAYHKIVADKPPDFQGAPPEYYEEIDLEAQRPGQMQTHGSSSRELTAVVGAVSSNQPEARRVSISRENQDTNSTATPSSTIPQAGGQGNASTALRQ